MFTKVAALAKANMKRFWRDPVSIFFTIAFPLMFLVIFGFIFGGDDDAFNASVALVNESDSELAIEVEERLTSSESFTIETFETDQDLDDALTRSQIQAVIVIDEAFGEIPGAPAMVGLQYLVSQESNVGPLRAILNAELFQLNNEIAPYTPPVIPVDQPLESEALDTLDYLVPGLMGFSILGLTVFGMSNGFTADKKTGSIARLKVAPIKSLHIVLSIAAVYAVLAIVSIAILVLVATLAFGFNQVGDWFSFAVFIVISTFSMLGIGTIIGGWAKNDKQAQPVTNLVAFPMMFLSGVFFPTFLMPDWLQTVAKFIPLTTVNEGLRLITTEGFFITELWLEILILGAWALISYPIAFKVFRWE